MLRTGSIWCPVLDGKPQAVDRGLSWYDRKRNIFLCIRRFNFISLICCFFSSCLLTASAVEISCSFKSSATRLLLYLIVPTILKAQSSETFGRRLTHGFVRCSIPQAGGSNSCCMVVLQHVHVMYVLVMLVECTSKPIASSQLLRPINAVDLFGGANVYML